MSLPDLTLQTIHQHKLVPPGSKLVVGVSGGADSLALLHVLHTHCESLKLELHVATFNHGLRGPAGAEDVRFVVATCQAWGIAVSAGSSVVEKQAGGIEQAARNARYDFLAQVAHTVGAQHIAVAHHAGDQTETVLLNLIRGAGLQGLGGMALRAPVPGHPDLILIRPMLRATRQAIEAYCVANDLHPRLDATNQDTDFLRNRVRLETLPHLRQINPHIDRALIQLGMIAQADHAFIHHEYELRTSGWRAVTEGRVTLPHDVFQQLPPALQNHHIRVAVQQLGGKDMGFEHVRHAVDLALRGRTGQIATLPGNIRLRLDYDEIVIEKAEALHTFEGPLLPKDTVLAVTIPGTTPLPESDWVLQTSHAPFTTDTPQAQLTFDEAQNVQLRTRRAGERFKPQGLCGHTQKIKKWMIDHKIPQAVRDQIPLLTMNGDIAAFMIDDRWIINESFVPNAQKQAILYAIFIQPNQS